MHTVNRAAMNMDEQVFKKDIVSLGCMPNRVTVRSCGIPISSHLRNLHTDFHSDFTSLQYHQQRIGFPLTLPLHCYFLSFFKKLFLFWLR